MPKFPKLLRRQVFLFFLSIKHYACLEDQSPIEVYEEKDKLPQTKIEKKEIKLSEKKGFYKNPTKSFIN